MSEAEGSNPSVATSDLEKIHEQPMIPSVKSKVSEDKANRVTQEERTAVWMCGNKTFSVKVPEGFEYKPGVSLRLGSLGLIDIFAPTYTLEDVSCFHDYLYKHRDEHDLTRAEADSIMAADKNDPYWIGFVAWLIVRLLGGIAWHT